MGETIRPLQCIFISTGPQPGAACPNPVIRPSPTRAKRLCRYGPSWATPPSRSFARGAPGNCVLATQLRPVGPSIQSGRSDARSAIGPRMRPRWPRDIALRLDVEDKQYRLTVTDNGVGFPESLDFRNTKSLGLKLVNALTGQLKGTIEVDRSGGTEFQITFETGNEKG